MVKKIQKNKKLSSNMEDYLEAIANLLRDNKVARVRDIGRVLNVKTPSVTAALDILSRSGLVIHQRYGYVELTEKGRGLAGRIEKTHEMLVKFLSEALGINSKLAQEDACRIEHSLSPETSRRLTKFVEFVEASLDSDRSGWLKSFDYYFKTGKLPRHKIK